MKSSIAHLGSDIRDLQAENLERKTEKWISRKVYANAIDSHLNYLNFIQKHGDHWELQDGLDKFVEILQGAIDHKYSTPDADQTAAVSRFLQSVSDKNPIIVKKLETLLARLCG